MLNTERVGDSDWV